MQKFIISGLCAALILSGWLYRNASRDLADAKTALTLARTVNEANQTEITRLHRSMESTDKILAEWNRDRTSLAAVRAELRQAITEAMHDELFTIWASSAVPAAAWRLLKAPADAGGNPSADSPGGTAGGLPANAGSGSGNERGPSGNCADAAH